MERHTQTELTHRLSALGKSKALAAQCGISPTELRIALDSDWSRSVGVLCARPERRVSCAQVLEACALPLNNLCPREPDGGWVKYLFAYSTHLSFPDEGFAKAAAPWRAGAEFALAVLQLCLDAERTLCAFDPLIDFDFLSDEEASGFGLGNDYLAFKAAWREQYVYEMHRLANEATPFRTLSHIAGVHHVAMNAARGLLAAGLPVDLTLASGASAAHDIGKFGCKPGERVPYLHYYYTDQWFRRIGLDSIGAIAANHSTWDLELANLPAEALCLIYADFRVKQNRGPNGEEITEIYSLKDSFDVILSKLDNVDEAKLRRYKFVYARLRDFEDYMRVLGVDCDLTGKPQVPAVLPEVSLRSVEQSIHTLLDLSTEHNIRVMAVLTRERSFGNLLETARTEKNWQNVNIYLDILSEYSTYLRPNQKVQALDFACELLMHREGDTRRRAAELAGQIIAEYNAGYRKERPAGTPDQAEQNAMELWGSLLERVISPDPLLTASHKSWIRYTLKLVVRSLFRRCPDSSRAELFQILMSWYARTDLTEEQAFPLLDNLYDFPLEFCSPDDLSLLIAFASRYLLDAQPHLRISAARFFKQLAAVLPADHPGRAQISALCAQMPTRGDSTMLYLQYRIMQGLGEDTTAQSQRLDDPAVVSQIFLDNLKTGVSWLRKVVNIKLLAERAPRCDSAELLHIATHLANLVEVSETISVRYDAGIALQRIAPLLPPDSRNEIAVELFKGLETGEYEFSKYIPDCLGEFALWLPPEQLDELVRSLRDSLASSNERIVSVALDTVAVLLECHPAYAARFEQTEEELDLRRRYLLGFLLAGLANHRPAVRQESLHRLGRLFSSTRLEQADKQVIFGLCCQKLLFLLSESSAKGDVLYYRAAALTRISQFITVCLVGQVPPAVPEWNKVAFFPGTFDPFTLSHKAIVRAIRNMGYEVYLAIDEFSWSKNTQPHLVRRQIASMSVSDMFHVHIFPDSIPVNLARPEDLGRLREIFAGRELYLVAGSDVIANASAYRVAPRKNSVHSLNHILFRRAARDEAQLERDRAARTAIQGEIVDLTLPAELEDISSTRIRDNLDHGRDISNLIDPVVQEYIYSSSTYLRAARFKAGLVEAPGSFRLIENPAPVEMEPLFRSLSPADAAECARLTRSDWMIFDQPSGVAGLAAFSIIQPHQLLSIVQSPAVADELRIRASGPVLLVQGVWRCRRSRDDAPSMLLSEILAHSLGQGCTYAAYMPLGGHASSYTQEALELIGFIPSPIAQSPAGLMLCDMHFPVMLLQNIEATFRAPFSELPSLHRVAQETHLRLQRAITHLWPGQLVLNLNSAVIQQRLAERITAMNGVPSKPTEPRVLGSLMCVPFGKLLRGRVVPNTVTKTLHTDRVYTADLSGCDIEAYPGYSSLESQIETLRSFGRPVILVDDLLHKNGRLNAILPLLKNAGVDVRAIMLGILSSRGADTMAGSGIPLSGIYHLPSLRYWFVDSTLYPFIGGDTVRRAEPPVNGLLPTINYVLPYAAPDLPGADPKAVFELSRVCLENARDIFKVLESEYSRMFGRNLTLSRLGEAVVLPTCPDRGSCIHYNSALSASVYLENDLEQLHRTGRLVK